MTPSVDRPSPSVLLINPRSGGGKARQHDLVGQCRARGIEPVVMTPEDDLAALAGAAVGSGAEIIGMAGGDGSQAVVAAVAAAHDVPYVCVPAGTRNHFALDIGVDRHDVVRALEAFREGIERRIDLAQVNGRTFVNNASMGLYGRIIQSPDYRDAKLRTVIERLPDLLGPELNQSDLQFTDPDGAEHRGAQLLLVSNNRYRLNPAGGRGTRGRMNQGVLGVVVAPGGQPPGRWREWTAPTFEVDSGSTIDIGIDGEALRLDPPLLFESRPSALRIRIPARRPGAGGARGSPVTRDMTRRVRSVDGRTDLDETADCRPGADG